MLPATASEPWVPSGWLRLSTKPFVRGPAAEIKFLSDSQSVPWQERLRRTVPRKRAGQGRPMFKALLEACGRNPDLITTAEAVKYSDYPHNI